MTLGGLALAVGILVDDATVTIENMERHLEEGKIHPDAHPDRRDTDNHAARYSTLCICVVFLPMFTRRTPPMLSSSVFCGSCDLHDGLVLPAVPHSFRRLAIYLIGQSASATVPSPQSLFFFPTGL